MCKQCATINKVIFYFKCYKEHLLTCTDYYSELRRETLPEWPEKLRLWKRDVVEGRGGGDDFFYTKIYGGFWGHV